MLEPEARPHEDLSASVIPPPFFSIIASILIRRGMSTSCTIVQNSISESPGCSQSVRASVKKLLLQVGLGMRLGSMLDALEEIGELHVGRHRPTLLELLDHGRFAACFPRIIRRRFGRSTQVAAARR